MGLKSFREQQRESIEETKRGRKFWKNRFQNLSHLPSKEIASPVSGQANSLIALEKPGRII